MKKITKHEIELFVIVIIVTVLVTFVSGWLEEIGYGNPISRALLSGASAGIFLAIYTFIKLK